MRSSLAITLCLLACGPKEADHEPQLPSPDPRVEDLSLAMDGAVDEAETLRNPVTGWLLETDCDAILWNGKYAAASRVTGVDLTAAEYPAPQQGRFSRRYYADPCWTPELGDVGSKTTWSRDMARGLFPAAWRKKDLALLTRHAAYGAANDWKLGEPLADGRVLYTPATIGLLYQTIHALGGEDNINRLWPDFYPAGLTDFQAHLQVMNIWQRGEVEEELARQSKPGNSDDAEPNKPMPDDASEVKQDDLPQGFALLNVNQQQLDRLREHAARDPRDPLFQAELGVYTGDMGPALDVCLDPAKPVGEYVRCNDFRRCQLAAWIFACDIVLRRYGR